MTEKEKTILDAEGINAALSQLAEQICSACGDAMPILVGIHTRGIPFARRLQELLVASGCNAPLGTLDISLYRDDHDNRNTMPILKSTAIPVTVDGARVILCDDVLFTGRTIRAALDGVMDLGRPAKIELAVLVDRHNRELPIQADYVGCDLPTTRDQHVRVFLKESDGHDAVLLLDSK